MCRNEVSIWLCALRCVGRRPFAWLYLWEETPAGWCTTPNANRHNKTNKWSENIGTFDISSMLSSPLSKMMSLLESLFDGLSGKKRKRCDAWAVGGGSRPLEEKLKKRTKKRHQRHLLHHRRHHHHPHHHWTGVRCTLRWRTSQWRWTTRLSWTGREAERCPPRRQAGRARWGAPVHFCAVAPCRLSSAARSCRCCSARLWRAIRASRSTRCNNGRYSRGSAATAASPRLWSVGTAYWLGSPGCVSPRSNNRLVCSEPGCGQNTKNFTAR